MAIKLNSNIYALTAQRHLNASTSRLTSAFERLSSGMRINRAADDAAGLSMAMSLGASARILTQGVRNVNDGISALNIAEGGARELSSILMRMRELATQSANGTFSNQQRTVMNTEAQELRNEFNRILTTTKFNGIGLLDGSLNGTTIQAGDVGSEIGISLSAFALAGSGTFGSFTSYSQIATHGNPSTDHPLTALDVNKDGNMDLVALGNNAFVTVMLGNGDGTFKAKVSYTSGQQSLNFGDVNNDGVIDLVTANAGTSTLFINLGNSDGSFRAPITGVAGSGVRGVGLGDFNRDGFLDVVHTGEGTEDALWISLGNGNGTFKYGISYATGDDPRSVAVGDVNGDGILDLTSTSATDGYVNVFLGNGDGSFSARTSYQSLVGINEIRLADFNQDDILDAVYSTNSSTLLVRMGNGNGTFKAQVTLPVANFSTDATIADFNGDDVPDIIAVSHAIGSYSVLLSNNDGTFRLSHTAATINAQSGAVVGADFNNDGILDIAVEGNNTSTIDVALGNSQALLQGFSIKTREKALSAIPVIDAALSRVNQQIGVLGAQQSRLSFAAAHLSQTKEALAAAESRIMDVDVAEETANMISARIKQEAATAILGQANVIPSLALVLLR